MKLSIRKVIIAATVAASASIPAFAGIKYWDNPAFKEYDVGDYVQDGLVVNYDGIRNQGPDAEHADSPTLWQNCASDGAWPMHWCSYVPTGSGSYRQWTKDNTTQGKWTTNGFAFDGYSYFAKWNEGSAFSIPSVYTIQFVAEAPIGNLKGNVGYLWQPATGWDQGGVGMRKNDGGSAATGRAYSCYMVDKTVNSGARSNFYPADHNLSYANFTVDYATTHKIRAFEGPLPTTDASANVTMNASPARSVNWFVVGGFHNKGTTVTDFECFVGTMHGVRFYTKVLSDEELLWNRVVDEARFFNRRAAIPVTNVVVSTTIPGVEGDQPCGAYALDADGYTFTAPTSRTIERKRYALGGYTLETWNGSSWVSDGAETHTGNSVALSDMTAKVRITWQYSRPEGEGQLAHYDVSDYVQNGLVVHFDGILNQGASSPHSYDAATWVNLGTGGSANDATLTVGTGGGNWTEDGYRFGGNGTKFVVNTAHTWHTNHTVQTLLDAAYADNTASSDGNYAFSASWNKAALPVRGGDSTKTVWFHTQGLAHTAMPRVANQDPERFTYATAIHNGTAGTACVFTGTEPPTSGGITTGFLSYESSMAEFTGTTAIGGWGGAAAQYLVGKVKSFRYYSRVLTNEEIAQNRKVDEYRFFGRYTVTNVVVASTYSYLEGYDKCGAYEVDGSYTFTAPASVEHNGITYACDGYTVETQDGIGWANATDYTGTSYLYQTTAGTVRLTWKWKATSGLRSAADYSFDDLSPAGLALHYDGIFNAGVGVGRSTTSTKWINLGSRPGMDLTRKNYTGFSPSWGEKGHVFPGRSMFESSTSVPWPTTFSAQVLVDAQFSDNTHQSGNYIAATTWKMFGMQIDGYRNLGRFNAQAQEDYSKRASYAAEDGIDYMTVIHDAKSKTATVFPGTKAPTSGAATDGYMHFDTFNGVENNKFRLGGWGGGTDVQCLVGTIYTFRYYDRVLTEEELVRNRNVDAVRYFGALGVTNVVVAIDADSTGISVTDGSKTNTAYFVEGEYTFTANGPAGLGYRLYKLTDGAQEFEQSFTQESSFTYRSGHYNTPILVEWRVRKPFFMVVR